MIDNISKCKLITLKDFSDDRGSITFVEYGKEIDFLVKRNYLIFNVPQNSERGFHAHKNLHQIIMCLSGSFQIELFDGANKEIFNLDSPLKALYICPMIWREMREFSQDAVCSVLASDVYDESDYIRNKKEFINIINKYI